MSRTGLVATRLTTQEKALVLSVATSKSLSVSELVARVLLSSLREEIRREAAEEDVER